MDKIVKVSHSLLQHGKDNNRIYLMKYDEKDKPYNLISYMDKLARKNKYSKIIAIVPSSVIEIFKKYGYIIEAKINKYYKGEENGIILSKFYNDKRKVIKNIDIINDVLEKSLMKRNAHKTLDENPKEQIKILSMDSSKEIVVLYTKVFEKYPFPIFQESYILETMEQNVVYFGMYYNNQLVGISSCEIDEKLKNCEMTDFAVIKEYREKKYAYKLLKAMEYEMKKRDIKTFYTIARSLSYGMNFVFAKNEYEFGGQLINNTNISSGIETMNVWYKNV
jgi:putative beta-lysine N-acetyltransferase